MKLRFPNIFLLLQQEGFVFRSSITQGLTALRRAREDDKGHCYSAFFNLSIGLERLLKVIMIIDHMCRNEMIPPSVRQIKSYGHEILQLFEATQEINVRHRPGQPIKLSKCEHDLFSFLDEFGTGARYYNVNELSGASQGRDPLSAWAGVLNSILDENNLLKTANSRREKAVVQASLISPDVFVVAHGLDRRPLTLEDAYATMRVHDLACKYAVYHVVRVLAELRDLTMTLSHLAGAIDRTQGKDIPTVPSMHEFLSFVDTDKRAILNKMRWQ